MVRQRSIHTRLLAVPLTIGSTLALVAAGAHAPASHPSDAPRVVRIVARDYAFEAPPDTLPAGDITFEFENRGAHDHELVVGRLRPGSTGADIVAAHQRGVTLRQLSQAYLAEAAGGALLAQPGVRSPARLVMPFARGQDYVLLCQLRDSAGKPPHAALGMFHLVHVR